MLEVNFGLLSGQVFGAAAVLAAASCVALHVVVGQADLRIDYFTFTLAALRWPPVRLQGSGEFSGPPLLSS